MAPPNAVIPGMGACSRRLASLTRCLKGRFTGMRLAEKTGGITPIVISGVEINLHVSVNRHIVQERNVVARM